MLWLEEKYVNIIANKLPLFHKVKQNLWNFRCPICGDSKKNKYKTRGSIYLHARGTSLNMGCFNCSASMSFFKFLKLVDENAYKEFVLERYQADNSAAVVPVSKSIEQPSQKRIALSGIDCIADLSEEHPAVRYVIKRKIEKQHWSKLYFVLRYKQWELDFKDPGKKFTGEDHPRLIIPFFDKRGNITRISARAFGNHDKKYIFIKVQPDASRVYGLDTIDPKKTVYVLEGPIDSLFIDNSIATGSADLLVPELNEYTSVVLIPDNQPRNSEVCSSIKKMVDSGLPVCLWNTDMGKDINDMITNGYSKEQIMQQIRASTVSGIAAKLKFGVWSKATMT